MSEKIALLIHPLGEVFFEDSAYWLLTYGEDDKRIKCKSLTDALTKLEEHSDRFEQWMESMEKD